MSHHSVENRQSLTLIDSMLLNGIRHVQIYRGRRSVFGRENALEAEDGWAMVEIETHSRRPWNWSAIFGRSEDLEMGRFLEASWP